MAYLVSLGAKFRPTPGKWKLREIVYMIEQFINRIIKKIVEDECEEMFARKEKLIEHSGIIPWKDIKMNYSYKEMREYNDGKIKKWRNEANLWFAPVIEWVTEFRAEQRRKMLKMTCYQTARRNLTKHQFEELRKMRKKSSATLQTKD